MAAPGFRGVYVDANAVAPGTARAIGDVVEAAGARFVDGGIIGPANRKPGAARIYLSGHAAARSRRSSPPAPSTRSCLTRPRAPPPR